MGSIKTGDIIYFRTLFHIFKPMSWLGVLIRLFTKVKYNHVGLIVLIEKLPFVIEAVGRGVIITPYRQRTNDKKIMIKRGSLSIKDSFSREALGYCGHTKYDVLGLVWHQLLWNITGVYTNAKNDSEAAERFYCYEFAAFMHRDKYPDWKTVNVNEFINASWQKMIFKN